MSKLIGCKGCGNQIHKAAKACPQCGAPHKQRSVLRTVAVLFVLGFVGIVVAGVAAAADGVQTVRENRETARREVATTTDVVNVSSDDLFRAYDANEVAADNQYKGRVLRVTGAVKSINKDFLNDAYVILWTPNEFEGVHAKFVDSSALASLTKGAHVTVQCRGNGKVISSPMLRDCVLQ